jgi:hypothetical protein
MAKGAALINDKASEAALAKLVQESVAASNIPGAIVDYQG